MNYAKDDLLFAPLGGSGEIGMNVNLYHYQDSWIMVDLGISFPDESTPGVDVILPDLKFIADRRDKLAGLVLTHGHEDHLGAIPYLWSQLGCPIYGSAFTLALLKRKLAESRGDFDIKLHEIGMNAPFKLGAFEVEMVALNHSIPDPAALAIRTDAGTIFHTGTGNSTKRRFLVPILTHRVLPPLVMRGSWHLLGIRPMPWLMGAPDRKVTPRRD
jgi:ribonuclease J